MKKVYFVFILALIHSLSLAQLTETEPNHEFSQATPLPHNTTISGTIGHPITGDEYWTYDEYDHFRVVLPHAGTMRLYIEANNQACPSGNFIELFLFDKNIIPHSNFRSYYFGGLYWNSANCTSTIIDTFEITALTADTFYLQMIGDLPAGYTIRYEMVEPAAADTEPNNSEGTAITITPNEIKKGNVSFRQAFPFDTEDYYKATLPAGGNIRVYVKALSRGPNASNNSNNRLRLLVSGSATTYTIPSTNPPSQILTNSTHIDTFRICGLAAGNVFLRLQSSTGTTSSNTTLRPYEYEIRYEVEPAPDTANDFEPDNTFEQSRFIGQGQKREGFVGANYNGVNDLYDYNKIAITTPGELTIYFKAQNISCTDNRIFGVWGYRNKVNSYVFLKRYVLNAVGTVDAGQVVEDSIKYDVPATTDTIFIRIEGNGLFKYEFSIKEMVPTSSFTLTGDTTACIGPAYTYKAINVFNDNVTYNWSLPLGGGTLTYKDSTATVHWNENANRRIQLNLSNQYGTSRTKQLNVIINGVAPTQVPVAYNFARTLSTNSLPPGGGTQWFRNGTAIPGATDSTYYAADAGSYTVKFTNDCGPGSPSNAIVFSEAAKPQTIAFPHVPTMSLTPTLKVTLAATSSSGLPVLYQKVSGPATLLNDTLFITGAGTIIVKASQPGDDTYSPATPKYDTITVLKGNQFIPFDSIPNQVLNSTDILLDKVSSAGLTITYTVVAGTAYASVNNLSGSSSSINKLGAGSVTLRATQNGNANYNAATPVERTFCIGIRTLTPIIGDANPCIATYRYNTQKIPGAVYEWTLSGGGILTTNKDTAWVQWQTPGSYTLQVKAYSPCDSVYTNEQTLTINTSGNPPTIVTGMQPENNALDQKLPLKLSWIPGSNTVNYDLYLWDSAATEPTIPYATNISTISYTLPKNSLAYNRAYKWRVVSKNPCSQTPGPVQQFRIIPLPDLVVSDVQAPSTANSGQTITISWKVTNIGPGTTFTADTWSDAVYFALDTVPHVSFRGSPNWNASSWNSLTANGRPLLLGKKVRPVALDSGQSYVNTLDFKLPLEYSFPVYVYVITDNGHPNYKILQASVTNDTARAAQPITINLSPNPDLRVDSVFTPVSLFSGSTVNLTYKVKNYGTLTPAGSSWTDSVFISQNPLFDRNASIPLTLPKKNGSYYPNAVDAHANINTQLQHDSVYTKSTQVVIPNFIFGTWFIYVKTNANTKAGGFVYEGAQNGNNLNRSQVEVYLTPTPKLTVTSLTVPVTTASTTQTVGANWSIFNEGFTDNFEKNKGHNLHKMIGRCPCSVSGPPGTVCVGPPKYLDSFSQGSSYWLDRVYLSKDSAGLNTANATLISELKHGFQQYSGLLYPDDMTDCISPGSYNVKHALYPGSVFPSDTSFRIPSDLQSGNYYVYVYTNPTKTVFEYPGTPQIKRSALPITVSRPDAVVSSVSVPSNSVGGQQLIVAYNVTNNGPGAVFNHSRKDRLYISNFSTFDESAILLSTQTFTESLPVGTAVPHTFVYNLPAATSGAKYFYVLTNFDSSFREMNSSNNLSVAAVTNVSAASPNDLTVASIQSEDTTFTIFPNSISYTVGNNGTGTTAGTWKDSLFISCSPTFNRTTSFYIGRKTQTRIIGPSQTYTDTISFAIPKMSYELYSCFPKTANATAYFFVKTNADTSVYEATNINNNITGSSAKVLTNPFVDYVVTKVTAPDTTTVGRPYNVTWIVRNIGYNPGRLYDGSHSGYYDAVYFSPDSIFNNNAVLANTYLKYTSIKTNDSLKNLKPVITPNLPTGDYYVFAVTNYSNDILGENVLTNNHNLIRNSEGKAKKIHLIRPLLPDLTDSILVAPALVTAGQPLIVIRRVTNKGTGITYPTSWQNKLLLSADFLAAPNDGDRLLAEKNMAGALLPGQFRDDTVTVTIPVTTIPGNYILIGEADSRTTMMEVNDNNNLAFSLLAVVAPPVTDLLVETITQPDTVYLGYTIDTARWVVRNASPNEAKGKLTHGIYLSKGSIFDSTAVLMGIQSETIDLDPLKTDTARFAPLVTNVVEGDYNLIVRTDLLNNFLEEDKANNTGISTTPIYVKVKELPLNVTEANTLHKVSRYYKLVIPDSLIGSTILVTLKSSDSLFVRNEMYMGGGYVPTPSKYDYKFEIPNYGNQQIVMTSVTNSVYYIDVRSVSPNPPVQNITLKAVKLPFAILNVHTASGGNIGNVTVKISGSLFRDSMTARLSKTGTTIDASAVYFTNSTTAYATFNLQGKPLGVYDVILTKPDATTAILANGFSVVAPNNGGLITGGGVNTGSGNGNEPGCDPGAESGLNSQLVVELLVPERVLTDRPVVILINYSNPTNFDIPAQSRILYAEDGVKMAFTKEGVPTGTTSLYMEFTEPGGPPGIIRAGGSGTITIYTRSPARVPDDASVLFKMK